MIRKTNKNFEKAVYNEQVISEYKNNPFIEALPKISKQVEVYDRLNNIYLYSDTERMLPLEYRYHMVQRFNNFFQPISMTLDLEKRLSLLIRSGYLGRNPLEKNSKQMLYDKNFHFESLYSNSFSLMGFPGMGKSKNIELLLAQYPQVILHEKPLNRLQIVWVKLNCPHDGSLKTLCISFFKVIDELIGTEYYIKFGSSKLSVSAMVTHMSHLAKVHAIGVLVIDEIQNLLGKRGNSLEQMMNFFVNLTNSVGIPVLLIGTMKAKSILQRDFRQARRSSGLGDLIWENFKEDDDEWDVILETLWKNQIIQNFTPLTLQMKKLLYQETQGIIDILIKLFWLSQCRAMEIGLEQLNTELIKQVSDDDLKLIKPFTNAMRSRKENEILKFEDIIPISLTEYLSNKNSQKVIIKDTKKDDEKQVTRFKEIMNYLEPLNLDLFKAEIIVKRILSHNKGVTLREVMKIVLDELDIKQGNNNFKDVGASLMKEILKLKQSGKNDDEIHKYLKDIGFIQSPLKDIS